MFAFTSGTNHFHWGWCIHAIKFLISSDVKVGKGVRLNYGATAMHDCNLGDFVTLAPQCMLLGGVTAGDMSYVGPCKLFYR